MHPMDAPEFDCGIVDACLEAQEENDKQPGHWRKESMSNKGLKSRRTGLLPDEENRKCSIVRSCAEFLSIGRLLGICLRG